jgi:hypothetical protein
LTLLAEAATVRPAGRQGRSSTFPDNEEKQPRAEADMKRALLVATLSAVLLAGCDTIRGWFGMPTNERPVVTVRNGQVSVSPEPLTFRQRGAVVIIWELDAESGFRFADRTGISIADPRGEFDDAKAIANGRKFQVRNKNSMKGRYKYTINLQGPTGPISHDPFIVNAE